MRCVSDVLKKKTLPPDFFGDVLEKVKHRPNDASNDVSHPALGQGGYKVGQKQNFYLISVLQI